VTDRQVFADRVHHFAAPTKVIFEALTQDRAQWLQLQPGEIEPHVLASRTYDQVTWSSVWPVSPTDTIEFELGRRSGGGTSLRFRWLTAHPPDARGIAITRQRLNRKLGGDLRGWTDSMSSPGSAAAG